MNTFRGSATIAGWAGQVGLPACPLFPCMKESDAEVRRSMDALEAEYWTVVGLCVKLRREAAGWSQAELARRTGLSRSEVQYIENARRHPKTGTLRRLCAAFRISLLEFMAQEDRMEWERRAAR